MYADKVKIGVHAPTPKICPIHKTRWNTGEWTNGYEKTEAGEYRWRHDGWIKSLGATPETWDVEKSQEDRVDKEAQTKRWVQSIAEQDMSGEEIVLNIGDNSYNLVCKDREIRKEIIVNKKKNWSKKQKKNARRAENRKNRVDKVRIPKITYHKKPHTKSNLIWEKSGLCYLATIKTSALNEYPWKMDISLIDLATMSRSIRKNIQFDLKEVGEDHHYELVPNPMSLTGWWTIDNIVSHRPFWTIGGDDTKDLPELINSNWLLWSLRMRAYLQVKEMWQYVDGTIEQLKKYIQEERSMPASVDEKGKEVKPRLAMVDTDQVDPKFMEWSKQDDKALGIMMLKIYPYLTYLLKLTA